MNPTKIPFPPIKAARRVATKVWDPVLVVHRISEDHNDLAGHPGEMLQPPVHKRLWSKKMPIGVHINFGTNKYGKHHRSIIPVTSCDDEVIFSNPSIFINQPVGILGTSMIYPLVMNDIVSMSTLIVDFSIVKMDKHTRKNIFHSELSVYQRVLTVHWIDYPYRFTNLLLGNLTRVLKLILKLSISQRTASFPSRNMKLETNSIPIRLTVVDKCPNVSHHPIIGDINSNRYGWFGDVQNAQLKRDINRKPWTNNPTLHWVNPALCTEKKSDELDPGSMASICSHLGLPRSQPYHVRIRTGRTVKSTTNLQCITKTFL